MSSTLNPMVSPYGVCNLVTASSFAMSVAALNMLPTTTLPYVSEFEFEIEVMTSTLSSQVKSYAELGLILSEYKISNGDWDLAKDLLKKNPDLKIFINKLPSILNLVYGEEIEKRLNVLTDPDTAELLIEISLYTGLPLDQDFDEKEGRLFDLIEEAGLSAGLRHVIISQR
ncbi:hypothetical protein [Methylomagnum ishizawai]|uniref:hypothetical protein n=1 Tax=Methylomagnum ishizawai TaxID=1760988 RepID=UPI001C32F146|nr:hypothetical protein [Methylomagnum ishizawai]BBL76533.1 hypothetical protein MishRS11D_36310 [Methylomagnum ishizawai]